MGTQRLWLQRRRHYAVVLLLYVAGLTGFGNINSSGPATVFAAAGALGLGGLLVTSLVVLCMPKLRRLCETVSMGMLAMAALVQISLVHPEDVLTLGLGTLGCTLIIYVLLYGSWWSLTGFRLNWTATRSFIAECPPQAAWARLVPDPENPGAHYSGAFLSQDPVQGYRDRILQRSLNRQGKVIETVLDIVKRHPPNQLVYSYSSQSPGADYEQGRFSLRITPHGRKSLIDFSETVRRLAFPTLLDLWFDDFAGEVRTSMASALNDLKAQTPRKLPRPQTILSKAS